MGAKDPIFTRSLWPFRSFRWGGSLRSLSWGAHSDHSAGGSFRSFSWGCHSYQTLELKPSALRAKAFSPQN